MIPDNVFSELAGLMWTRLTEAKNMFPKVEKALDETHNVLLSTDYAMSKLKDVADFLTAESHDTEYVDAVKPLLDAWEKSKGNQIMHMLDGEGSTKKSAWINAKTQKPADDGNVLVISDFGTNIFVAYYDVEEERWYAMPSDEELFINILFWMPLPEKPAGV